MRILAGDIGGTHARLIYVDDDPGCPVRHSGSYACAGYPGLMHVIEAFLSQHAIDKSFDAVCLAVAGPVFAGKVAITNLPWDIFDDRLAAHLGTRNLFLINDLVAVAWAVPGLQPDGIVLLQAGPDQASILRRAAVVGVGTGLGAAELVWSGKQYTVLSSEAGHAGFAAATAEQEQLLAWLHQRHDHVSVEMLLSGNGIRRLYRFFRDVLGVTESSRVAAQIAQADDPAALISRRALAADDELCTRTLACFVEILGAAVGDIALHYFPLNAIYLAGGVVVGIAPLLKDRRFLHALTRKGPMRTHLQKLSVTLIISGTAGLDGAVAYACRQYGR